MSGPDVLEARFQGRVGALELDAAFEVPARGVTALFGPSGAGKTTLLRCIAGLQRLPGRLVVKGQVWQEGGRFLPPWRRRVGFVFQDGALLAHLSVRGNLMYAVERASRQSGSGLAIRKRASKETSELFPDHENREKLGRAGAEARVAFGETTALLGLERLLDRPVGKLSGGEARRVAIARALLSQPELLLLDEPLSGLDLDAKAEALAYLERLHAELSVPMLFVSHDPGEIARLADRVLVMQAGRIVETPAAAGAAGLDLEAARARLASESPDRVARLALAALMAGLDPDEFRSNRSEF